MSEQVAVGQAARAFDDTYHTPIMVGEVLAGLSVASGGMYIDGTVGGGGHTLAIIRAGGQILGLDQDDEALVSAARRFSQAGVSGKIQLLKGNFRDIAELVRSVGVEQVDGILLDLGVSSHQLDDPKRGFRFDADELDMRMDQKSGGLTAAEFLAQLGEKDLAQLLRDLGEERYAKQFARAIVRRRLERPITQASDLRDIIWQASPLAYRHGSIHPATRTFQALRLAVNDELGSLAHALPQALELLKPGGRLVVLSFHSLEDRIVKRFMQQSMEVVTKKPMLASAEEIEENPRARSAKLRVAEKGPVSIGNED